VAALDGGIGSDIFGLGESRDKDTARVMSVERPQWYDVAFVTLPASCDAAGDLSLLEIILIFQFITNSLLEHDWQPSACKLDWQVYLAVECDLAT